MSEKRKSGAKCPKCGGHLRVSRTLHTQSGSVIRYRKCEKCNLTVKTCEKIGKK